MPTRSSTRGIPYFQAFKTLLSVTVLFFSVSVMAFEPSAPPTSNGSYSVTYPPTVAGYGTFLEERVGTNGTWNWLFGVGNPAVFTNKPPGTYYYRTAYMWFDLVCGPVECSGGGLQTVTSSAISVNVTQGPPPPLDSYEQQLQYEYEVRTGDLNGDGIQDLYIKRTAGGVPGNGVLEKTFLTGNDSGGFSVYNANDALFSLAEAWPLRPIEIALEDINLDGYVDLTTRNLSDVLPGTLDQIVFSAGEPYAGQAEQATSIDDKVVNFFRDINKWMFDPDYFDQAMSTTISYNVKMERWAQECQYPYGCTQLAPYLFPVDIGTYTLDELGVGAPLNTSSAYATARQNIAADAEAADCFYANFDCDPWCGMDARPHNGNTLWLYWEDVWSLTTTESFDSVNYSKEAWDLVKILETIMNGGNWDIVPGSAEARAIDDILSEVLGGIDTDVAYSDNDWTENWFRRGNHRYSYLSEAICSVGSGGCDFDVMVTILNTVGVHPNQTSPFTPGEEYFGDVNIPGPFGVDQVESTAIYDENGVQTGVRNETLLDHPLHPGVVQRTIVEVDGSYHIYTEGGGFGTYGGPNVWFDDYVWDAVDQRVIDHYR